jgi:hypothetical protein
VGRAEEDKAVRAVPAAEEKDKAAVRVREAGPEAAARVRAADSASEKFGGAVAAEVEARVRVVEPAEATTRGTAEAGADLRFQAAEDLRQEGREPAHLAAREEGAAAAEAGLRLAGVVPWCKGPPGRFIFHLRASILALVDKAPVDKAANREVQAEQAEARTPGTSWEEAVPMAERTSTRMRAVFGSTHEAATLLQANRAEVREPTDQGP